MIILLFATVLDGWNPPPVGSGISDRTFEISEACSLDTRLSSAYIAFQTASGAKRQSRILLARDIHPTL